ncbi:MAG: HAD family hydrolase [bacterium]
MDEAQVSDLLERISRCSRPMDPLPTDMEARIHPLKGIRAVLFDVYGTLVVSASGDIGSVLHAAPPADAFRDALRAAGFDAPPGAVARGPALLVERIQEEHARRRAAGVEFPEIEIRETWDAVLSELRRDGSLSGSCDRATIERLAVEFECRVNPTWPMPGAAETLSALEKRGFVTGIVSNAQFYSPLIFRTHLGRPPPEPAVWSFEQREAKPSGRLFRLALDALAGSHGIRPGEVLYVGNDMTKDMTPSALLGFRTALFAGDRRSYRPAAWKPPAIPPDVVITDLSQLVTDLLAP